MRKLSDKEVKASVYKTSKKQMENPKPGNMTMCRHQTTELQWSGGLDNIIIH